MNTISTPCYNKFSEVTEAHENTVIYLTKEKAYYYILQGRKFSRKDDCLDLKVNYRKSKTSYEMSIDTQ